MHCPLCLTTVPCIYKNNENLLQQKYAFHYPSTSLSTIYFLIEEEIKKI